MLLSTSKPVPVDWKEGRTWREIQGEIKTEREEKQAVQRETEHVE